MKSVADNGNTTKRTIVKPYPTKWTCPIIYNIIREQTKWLQKEVLTILI